ncbi:MAG: protein translocase subunit SecD [Phycisphaerales bacterium]
MRTLVRNAIILAVLTIIAVVAINPPEKKLRRGKDLAGGASLVYQVFTKPGDTDVMGKVISVLKNRVDPQGVMEISFEPQGADRIEITMPLPDKKVLRLRDEFEAALEQFSSTALTPEQFERIAAMPLEARRAEIARVAAGDPARLEKLETAASLYIDWQRERSEYAKARDELAAVQSRISELRNAGEADDGELMKPLLAAESAARARMNAIVDTVAALEIAYEEARDGGLKGGLTAADVRLALQQPTTELRLADKKGKVVVRKSPRDQAIAELKEAYPAQVEQIDAAIAKWNAYEKDRRTLDDPSDLVRILKGAGVLNFRITVDPGTYPAEADVRAQLRAGGPRSVKSADARWYKINKIDGWINNSVEALEELQQNGPAAFFQSRGYVVDVYKGSMYMLCWDTRGQRLTEDDGDWSLADARPSFDELGRPAISFSMDALGADKLGELTGKNVGKRMAVLLDDEVYTAPVLNSRIANSGIIQGTFSPAEIDYVVRVLSAGSLRAKLSEEPISVNTLGPELGADNLQRGLYAGIVSFVIVAGFMVVYYFSSGLIAVIGLCFNALFLLALMALNHAAFTLPGIAGVILAFGMAVDANVLIYERLREELNNGNDLRTAVRLAYSRAMAPIVDGNLTHLITCLVLGFFGTQEIKGFAVTMSIGVLTTLFCQLFITRLLYTVLTEKFRLRKLSMLPMAVPAIQRAMSPNIDWMRLAKPFAVVSTIAVIASIVLVVGRGSSLLDTEFTGGTKVSIQLKKDENGRQLTMTRAEVAEEIKKIAAENRTGPLAELQQAEVLAVNPEKDNVTSSQFTIKSSITDARTILEVVSRAFGDKLSQEDAIAFTGSDIRNAAAAPVFPIVSPNLAEVLDRPEAAIQAPEFVGGAAIVLDNLGPNLPSVEQISNRIKHMKQDAQFSESIHRTHQVRVLKGTEREVQSALILVQDDAINYLNDPTLWSADLRPQEWALVVAAMERSSNAAAVQSFSPSVAADFAANAVVSILLAAVLILIYVGVRFNSVRYSSGALIATLHDCIVALGFIALGEVVYKSAPGVASALGILPFKIDLNVIAAVLTILGYSLNDKIVVMDRIRENRGKLRYASRKLINDSVNQTISRTIMTGVTTFLASAVLYVFGGEAMRAFAYCFMIGVVIGTFSSVAIAAPFVCSRKSEGPGTDPAAGSATAERAVPAGVA